MTGRDDNLERAKDVVIIFLAGVAIVLGLCLASYIFAMFMDRYGGWICQERAPPLTEQQLTTHRRAAPSTIQAGLVGVTKEERQKVLDYFFSRNSTYEYKSVEGGWKGVKKKKGEGTTSDLENQKDNARSQSNSGRKEDEDADCRINGCSDNPRSRNSTKRVKKRKARPCNSIPAVPRGNVEGTEIPNYVSGEDPEVENDNNHKTSAVGNDADDGELQEICMMEHQEGTCPICLMEYANGEKVMTGTSCSHLFHYECAMQWLCKKHHYHCPYCRKDMLTVSELRKAAEHVLGDERMDELAQHSILASTMFPPDTFEIADSRSTAATSATQASSTLRS